jgi:hypothetical protein
VFWGSPWVSPSCPKRSMRVKATLAASTPRRPGSPPKRARHGKWIELTSDQWQFLRGIYAMNPLTPPGLPYGDKAALVKIDGRSGGIVFFIDGDMACTPMAVPDQLLAMMDAVATTKISHEGSAL